LHKLQITSLPRQLASDNQNERKEET
jgi:hypothetical protein